MIDFNKLPKKMQNDEVKKYVKVLNQKKCALSIKRYFDLFLSLNMLYYSIPFLSIIALLIKLDSKGEIFYRQTRVGKNLKPFKIVKFRTMVKDADKKGPAITTNNDSRITKIGAILRKFRLDEVPQLINIILGDMSFVGPRPEATKYVEKYKDEFLATLLVSPGVTARASIAFKDEAKLLDEALDPDKVYVEKVLPEKMKYNLDYLKKLGLKEDIKTMIDTVIAVLK